MVKKIGVFIMILGLFFVGMPRFNVNAQVYDNGNVVNVTNLSQLNAVEPEVYSDKNLASPDIESIYLGRDFVPGGVYVLHKQSGGTLTYDVYNGEFRFFGNIMGGFLYNFGFDRPAGDVYIQAWKTKEVIWENSGTLVIFGGGGLNQVNIRKTIDYDGKQPANYVPDMSISNYQITGQIDVYFKLQIVKGDTATPFTVPLEPLLFHERLDAWWTGQEQGFDEGWDIGYSFADVDIKEAYDQGLIKGQEIGDYQGYNRGFERGKSVGYNEGLNETDATGFVALLSTIFGGLGTLLSIELLPGIYIGAIIAVPLVFGIIFFILGKRKGD